MRPEFLTFRAIDVDADGELNEAELRAALNARGVVVPDDLGQVLGACDIARTGKLNQVEFFAARCGAHASLAREPLESSREKATPRGP